MTKVMANDRLLVTQPWWDSPEEMEEAEANARLIAAAPRMYDFVRRTSSVLKSAALFIDNPGILAQIHAFVDECDRILSLGD